MNVKSSGRKIDDIRFGRNNRVLGASGCFHQIDVSFIDRSCEDPTLVFIECKNTPSKPIEKSQVATLSAIIEDLRKEHSNKYKVIGLIAYADKARSGAIRFAEYANIQMEMTGIKPDFAFKYANLASVGFLMDATSSTDCIANIIRACKICGKKFETYDNEIIHCNKCKHL